MSSSFGDGLLSDFDLDFLPKTPSLDINKYEKQKRAMRAVKHRVISTDAILKKYLQLKEYKESLQKSLVEEREQYKKVCLDFNHATEKVASLEETELRLSAENRELEEKCTVSENMCSANQSHVNQLQNLIKEHETKLMVLDIENRLEKEGSKDLGKKISLLEKENISLQKDLYILRDAMCGEKNKDDNIVKTLLTKYRHRKNLPTKLENTDVAETKIEDESCEPDFICGDSNHSGDDVDMFGDFEIDQSQTIYSIVPVMEGKIELSTHILEDECTQDFSDIQNIEGNSKENTEVFSDIDHDYECRNENKIVHSVDPGNDSECSNENEIVHSVDTGRGSSLASGSEKCFLSPEYFDSDSPLITEVIFSNNTQEGLSENEQNIVADSQTTRPVVLEIVETTEKDVLISRKQLKDVATSPTRSEMTQELDNNFQNEETSICKVAIDSVPNSIEIIKEQFEKDETCSKKMTLRDSSLVITHEADLSEPQCVEVNDNSVDCEVSTILSTMRLDYSLITPLAPSPTVSLLGSNTSLSNVENISQPTVCPEMVKVREEIKSLHVKMADLTKEVTDLHSMMKDFFLNQANSQSKIQERRNICSTQNISLVCDETTPDEPNDPIIETPLVNRVAPVDEAIITSSDLVNSPNEEDTMVPDDDDDDDALKIQVLSPFPVETAEENKNCFLSNDCHKNPKLDHESNNNHVKKLCKNKKMTKLEKLRKNLLPKNKIKTIESPSKRRKNKTAMRIVPPWNKSSKLTSSASLNDTVVYEKALAVVAELRAQEKLKHELASKKKFIKTKANLTDNQEGILKENFKEFNNDLIAKKPVEIVKLTESSQIVVKNKPENTNESISSCDMKENTSSKTEKNKADTSSNKKRKCSCTPESSPRSTGRITRSKTKESTSTLLSGTKSEDKQDSKELNSPVTRTRRKVCKSALFEDETSPRTKKLNLFECSPNKEINSALADTNKAGLSPLRQTDDKLVYETTEITKSQEKLEETLKFPADVPKRKSRRNSLTLWLEDCQLSMQNTGNGASLNLVGSNPQKEEENLEHRDKPSVESSKNVIKTPSKMDNISKINYTIESFSYHKTVKNRGFQDSGYKNSTSTRLCEGLNKTPEVLKRISFDQSPVVLVENIDHEIKKQMSLRKLSFSKTSTSEDEAPMTVDRRKSLKRPCADLLDVQTKRVLRSSKVSESEDTCAAVADVKLPIGNNKQEVSLVLNKNDEIPRSIKEYKDLNLFSDTETKTKPNSNDHVNRKESVLCRMIEKYGMKHVFRKSKIVSENIINNICENIKEGIAAIIDLQPAEAKEAMDKLTNDLKLLNHKHFLLGLMTYLKKTDRRTELYNKSGNYPAPSMTKPEQVLLYIIPQLQKRWPSVNVINEILKSIEYTIFRLNATPEFDTIESLSHFYAVLCRYIRAKNRLRLFMLDAMYCISYKAMPLIRECLDVWTHVIPLSHMGIAKCPVVVCLVYLLHFYKCEKDSFNNVQNIRSILQRKYSFDMSEWNETKIMEFLKQSILDIREIPLEKKMMRLALIIFAKRQGPKWCQKNIINNLILPIIGNDEVPARIKQFCISTLGPLLKPFPKEMKLHCEIVSNQLFDMLEQNNSQEIEEAIFTALLYTRKHSFYRVQKALLSWHPQRPLSPELEKLLCDYVREKPLREWMSTLSTIT